MFRKCWFSLEICAFRSSYFNHSHLFSKPRVGVSPHLTFTPAAQPLHATLSTSKMDDSPKPRRTIPDLDKATRPEILRGLESYLGAPFRKDPLAPNPSPLVIVISGPSGVGKDAVIKKLREERPNLHFVITATSRPIRPGEVDGEDYIFVSKDEFMSMVEKDELLEAALVYGDYKGIPKRQIKEQLGKGMDVVLRVDVQGASTLRRILGNSAVFVFLTAESQLKLVERLIDRKTDKIEDLIVRIATSKEEMKFVDNFDYIVVNAEGKLDETVRLIGSIVDAEKAKVVPRKVVF